MFYLIAKGANVNLLYDDGFLNQEDRESQDKEFNSLLVKMILVKGFNLASINKHSTTKRKFVLESIKEEVLDIRIRPLFCLTMLKLYHNGDKMNAR